ncbi:MAG: ArnT family glycosyltransferase [Nitrospinota bacterium]
MNKTIEVAAVLLIVLLAFFFRYWHLTSIGWVTEETTFLLGMQTENSSPFHFSDADYYHNLALDYLNGKGLNLPFPPPFTLFFLIAAYKALGVNFFLVKVVYAVVSSLSLIPTYLIARLGFGKAEGVLTIVLCALSFNLIFITGGLNIENIYLFTLSFALLFYTLIYSKPPDTRFFPPLSLLFGFFSAIAALTRSEFVLIFATLIFCIALRKGVPLSFNLRIAVFSLLGFSLTLFPWGYRNYQYMKNFNLLYPETGLPLLVPTSLNGPLNFFQGHNPKANGTYTPEFLGSMSGGSFKSVDFSNKDHLSYMVDGYKLGLDYIFENPKKELSLVPVKLGIFFRGLSNGFFLNNFPVGLSGGPETMADSFVPSSKAVIPIGLVLFFSGWVGATRLKGAPAIKYLPVLLLGTVLLINLAFYGLSRLVYPMLPYYFMMVAVGVVYLMKKTVLYEKVRPVHILALLIGVFLIGSYQAKGFVVLREKTGSKNYTLEVHEVIKKGVL